MLANHVGLCVCFPDSMAAQLACKEEETEAALKRAREVLVGVRRKRPAPHLDDKVLTSWNGLMASS